MLGMHMRTSFASVLAQMRVNRWWWVVGEVMFNTAEACACVANLFLVRNKLKV